MLSVPETTEHQVSQSEARQSKQITLLMRLRGITILLVLLIFIGFFAYQIDFAFPGTPSLNNTYTPLSHPTAQEIGSYDVLGKVVSKAEAENLLNTEEEKQQLSADNGAVAITEDLIALGRKAFYRETFGNEIFFTDVTGILNGPLNIGNLTKAILSLKGQPLFNKEQSSLRRLDVLNATVDVTLQTITLLQNKKSKHNLHGQ